jgi:hypothetical protein
VQRVTLGMLMTVIAVVADRVIHAEGRRGAAQWRCQAPAAASWCLLELHQVVSVEVVSRHCERAADLPRRFKRLIRRLCLVCANTGSTICLVSSLEPAAVVVREHIAHPGVASALSSRPGSVTLAGIRRDLYLGAVADDVFDLVFMPVAGVSDRDPRASR